MPGNWRLPALLACAAGGSWCGEGVYSVSRGSCEIRWEVAGPGVGQGVLRHRPQCSLPLAEQAPLLAELLERIRRDGVKARALSWGRLYPDGKPDPTLAVRLAVAAKRSPQWDAARGRPSGGDPNGFVRKLANDAMIYAELRDAFRKAGLDIRISVVEKVLVLPARQLPFFDRLAAEGVKPADRLPFDCITWFAISQP